jgi:hypothetical protein
MTVSHAMNLCLASALFILQKLLSYFSGRRIINDSSPLIIRLSFHPILHTWNDVLFQGKKRRKLDELRVMMM